MPDCQYGVEYSAINLFIAGSGEEPRLVDVFKMGRETKKVLVRTAIQTEDQDHEAFLSKIKARMDE